jgi:hypothetical protein
MSNQVTEPSLGYLTLLYLVNPEISYPRPNSEIEYLPVGTNLPLLYVIMVGGWCISKVCNDTSCTVEEVIFKRDYPTSIPNFKSSRKRGRGL